MKKITALLTIVFFIGVSTSLLAQEDRKLSNGFSFMLSLGFGASDYALASETPLTDEAKLGSIHGIRLGNRWYFNPQQNYGIGLMVNWVDMTWARSSGTSGDEDWRRSADDFTLLALGPIGTYVLSDDFALDGYYNLRPTSFIGEVDYVTSSGIDKTYSYSGIGFTHALGGAIRYRRLNIGVEYVMGNIKSNADETDGNSVSDIGKQQTNANNFRIVVGFKL